MITAKELRAEVLLALPDAISNYKDNKETNVRIVEEVRATIKDLADGIIPNANHIAELASAVNENIQMRDFLMGLRSEEAIAPYVYQYLELVGGVLIKEAAVPVVTVFSTYLYEIGEKEAAQNLIQDVLETNPKYSLARLLEQTYKSNAPTDMLANMAKELHKSVLANIYEKETA